MSRPRLRAVQSRDRVTAELARDTQAAIDTVPLFETKTVVSQYTEPFLVALDHEPTAVLLVRLQQDAQPETEEVALTALPFVYQTGGVSIISMEGPTIGTRYRFTFLVIG